MRDTSGWDDIDWVDLIPERGAFVSPTRSDFVIQGETVNALNWLHAHYVWLQRQVERSGEEWSQCAVCNQIIRYAVVFRDPRGFVHIVGQDCGRLINSGLNPKKYYERQFLERIKEIKTKNGQRFVLSLPVPAWFWDVPKADRPKWISLKRLDPGWYVTIWGETLGEVVEHYGQYKDLKR